MLGLTVILWLHITTCGSFRKKFVFLKASVWNRKGIFANLKIGLEKEFTFIDFLEIDERPIGIFDSGVGGLSVLKQLLRVFPQENYIYLGDTARLPYGTKSAGIIQQYAEQALSFLLQKNVKAIVIACNSVSSQFREKSFHGIPVLHVIGPASRLAVQVSEKKSIGVLGTRATIESGRYRDSILAFAPEAEVFSQPCPLFVPLAEEALVDDPITNLISYRYIKPLLDQGIDTLIMGCTHYPILRASIEKVVGHRVSLIDPGEALATELKYQNSFVPKQPGAAGRPLKILTTDSSNSVRILLDLLLPQVECVFEFVTL